MKLTILLTATAPVLRLVTAHYNFPTIIYDNITYKHWQYVRHWTTGDDYGNDDDFTPIYSFNTTNNMFSLTMRCNANATFAPETLTVQAGKTLGFQLHAGIDGYLNHPGPLLAYMAKVPIGKTAQNWDGDGKMWFKISEDFPTAWSPTETIDGINYTSPIWPNFGKQELHFPIPPSTPSGQYLFRIEHIGLHETWQGRRGAQFFVSCAQIEVIGGGEGRPGPLVAFPGAYGFDDPIFGEPLLQSVDKKGTQSWVTRTPGPAVWSG